MRRAILLSLIILLSQPLVLATDISSNTEADSNGTLSGNYTVKEGATWTISGNYEVADGTSIVVEEGGTMIVSGSMNSTMPPQLDLTPTASVVVPVNNLAPTGTMRIHFAGVVVYDIDIEINNETESNWNGSDEYDWTGNMDVENITINISNNHFNQAIISHITLSPTGASPVVIGAEMLSGEGTSVIVPDKQRSWNIDVQGELIISGMIFGSAITCNGKCSLDGADMKGSGPIDVYGEINVKDSTFDNGVIDEDILVWDDAILSWENSTGTGGETDNWVEILSSRTIGVENSYVWFQGFDMGYDSANTSQLRDNSSFNQQNWGDNIIEIGEEKRDRIVRWQNGSGVIHEESASGKIVLSTPWGVYEKNIADLPKVNHFEASLDLPMLNFDSLVEKSEKGTTNIRLGVMATITNSGNAPASFLIPCTTNGEIANVGLTVTRTVESGETLEIPLNWDSAVEGDLTLECTIFVPPEFEGYDVVGVDTATTNSVTWSESSDDSSNMVVPISIGIALAVGIFAFVVWRSKQAQLAKDYSMQDGSAEFIDDDIGTIE